MDYLPGWAAFCVEMLVVAGGKVRSGKDMLIESAEAWLAAASEINRAAAKGFIIGSII